jgi:hypothetical protein
VVPCPDEMLVVCVGGPEEQCGHGNKSRRTPIVQTVAACNDRHVSVDVPSSTAWRLFQSLEEERVSFFFFLILGQGLPMTYKMGFQY